ncbi:hypothetical protein [Aquimarina agarilytica]|uniref:hypothetical protein n=1 Tax=Aquimarina agarilytica TaxID=1087449 RepID=UPI000289485D|nr:hypothetical protein [Aquimarina agarilytica]
MKNFPILAISLLFVVKTYSQSECTDAFSAANYSVAHTNNAYEATNTDHVQEWTEKAIETLNEVEQITANCGCSDASNFAYEGIVAAEKSLEENTWERSRFYAKRARAKAKLMISALSDCANTDVSKYRNRNENTSVDEYAVADNSYNDDYDNIAAGRDELVAEQEALMRRQKEIKLKIEKKKQEELQLKQQKHIELQKQLSVKSNAEAALAQIESAYANLAKTLGCGQAYQAAKQNYTISQQQLKNEKLNDTKFRYTEKLSELSEKAMLHFSNCAEGF